MPDDKSKTDNRDLQRVAGGEDYEVRYLVKETGITHEQALELVKRHGNDRKMLLLHARHVV
jgi:hypothetical protein